MVSPVIVEYIKTNLAKGFTEDQITKSLSSSNWTDDQISDAFKEFHAIDRVSNNVSALPSDKISIKSTTEMEPEKNFHPLWVVVGSVLFMAVVIIIFSFFT